MKALDFIEGINKKTGKAWEKIYMVYYSPLCHYAMRILNDEEQAKDSVQTAIVRLWEMPLHFNDIAAFNSYLYRMVNNICLKEIRKRNSEDKCIKEWTFYTEDMDSKSLSAVVFEELLRKLHQLIDEMPPQRRKVILLSMKKLSNEEISIALNISLNTVKKHKKEAYAVIKKSLRFDLFFIFCLFP